ncbi:hypothetical protein G5V57_16710 [Nordella sp. HKS 07]|uniref:hypothetical protein n=1 Tax=Nordella sp. HKS 07 TaxID=2712222 RepID=UPI0013E11AA5|nr:hypothetical protein [Nordella sp. HKS 07]QIG49214.1 hypothetical protein G5V57_16710 [Nordella sp. HKS 07]
MVKQPLFSDGDASDLGYVNVRKADNEYTGPARAHCEWLWDHFERYADPEFLIEIRKNFDARYWEMYLTVYLISKGHKVDCPKPGPDVGIEVDGRRVWFEATTLTRGDDGKPDQVPPKPEPGKAYTVPNEKMLLRYLNGISTKRAQHSSWVKNGFVKPEDALIVAINPRCLGYEHADTTPPRILQAAFAVGDPYFVLNRDTMKVVDAGYHVRNVIKKASEAEVTNGVFLQEQYAHLSGLLCSRVDCVNRPEKMGLDFQLAPNPHAKAPLPQSFRLDGTYYRVSENHDSSYSVAPEQL